MDGRMVGDASQMHSLSRICAASPTSLFLRRFDTRRQQLLDQLRVIAVVEPNDPFLATSRDNSAVRADADRVEEIVDGAELPHRAAVIDVPHPHRLVARAGYDLRRGAHKHEP